jgi:hypothetical protein
MYRSQSARLSQEGVWEHGESSSQPSSQEPYSQVEDLTQGMHWIQSSVPVSRPGLGIHLLHQRLGIHLLHQLMRLVVVREIGLGVEIEYYSVSLVIKVLDYL